MRKGRDGETGKKGGKITAEIVATNTIARWPPKGDRLQRRPLVPIKASEIGNQNIDDF